MKYSVVKDIVVYHSVVQCSAVKCSVVYYSLFEGSAKVYTAGRSVCACGGSLMDSKLLKTQCALDIAYCLYCQWQYSLEIPRLYCRDPACSSANAPNTRILCILGICS